MYQYSLGYYTSLFSRCIADSERSSDLTMRLSNIINYATLIIYQNICRGLFEKDKLLFSASICFQIMRNCGDIHDTEWSLFIRGPGAVERLGMPANPHPDSIPAPMWDILYCAEQRVRYVVPPPPPAEGSAPVEFDGYDDPTYHRSSDAAPFMGLCASLRDRYGGTGGCLLSSSLA